MLSEALLENWTLSLFQQVGYTIVAGAEIAPGAERAERADSTEVLLAGRLRDALARLNPDLPAAALEEAFTRISRPNSPAPLENNRVFHGMLVNGVPVEYQRPDGTIGVAYARVIDFDKPDANDWLVVNQFIVRGAGQVRRPDIIVFVNGLPLAVVELKNPSDADATTYQAWNQLQIYKQQISDLFVYNEVLVVSDGVDARIGSLTASFERFMPWRAIAGEALAPASMPQLQVLIFGVFEHGRFLELLRGFIVFEEGDPLEKKIAAYHQFHAVQLAVEATVRAIDVEGSRRCGVIWHTQGSGKSLTMVFYAGQLVVHPALQNPTIVVLTDRNDLDDQLFGTFARCHELLHQTPVQANGREHLQTLLRVASGGVIFTTIQKFLPPDGNREPLSERRNIVVIADEAHRSQYGFGSRLDPVTGELTYGFAQRVRDALPHASFLGFTGTPIEQTDRNTRQVFGEYISVYDIQQSVQDGATVPIFYENRVAKLDLDERERPYLDDEFEEVTEGEETARKESLKSKWTALSAIVGTEKRLSLLAADLVRHFEEREEVLRGKAMIVCMTRRICVDLYNQIIRLRPEWHGDRDDEGAIKVVMTGDSGDDAAWLPHIRTKARREALAHRFRNPQTSLKLVIVRDMWLTGFDAPCLHSMYVDKPMKGHNLMQAIARVNRVFRDKPGGLVVDYLGLTDQLRQALKTYTLSEGKGELKRDQEKEIEVMQTKYEICCNLFYSFDWSTWQDGTPGERLSLLPAAQEHIFELDDGVTRLNQAVKELSRAHVLAMPAKEALDIRDDVAFFQAIQTAVSKTTASGRPVNDARLDLAVQQLVARAIAPDKVIDIFATAGLSKPDISILSEEFLEEVRAMPQKHLAVELLRKLLNDEVTTRSRTNLVQARSFADMLERAIRAYQNRAIETVQVIEELIELANDLRAAGERGKQLKLSTDELAFYEALGVNDSAVKVLGDDTLRAIAQELAITVRSNADLDWTVRENVRARMRVMIKRILRHYDYPPDKADRAIQTVIEQAELLSERWAAA